MKKFIGFIMISFLIASCSDSGSIEDKSNDISENTEIEETKIDEELPNSEDKQIAENEITNLDNVGLKIISPKEWGEVVNYNTTVVGEDQIGTFYFDKIGKKGTNFGENKINNIPFTISYWSYQNVIDHNQILEEESTTLGGTRLDIDDKIYNQDNIIDKVCQDVGCYAIKEIENGNDKIYRIGEVGKYGELYSEVQYVKILGDKNLYLTITPTYSDEKELDSDILDFKYLEELHVSEEFYNKNIELKKLGLSEKDFEPLDAVANEFFSNVEFENTLTQEAKDKKLQIIKDQNNK